MYLLIWQRLIGEAFLDILYFPVWWFTGGAKHVLFWCFDLLKSGNATLAPGLWLANILVPMFGQYDWQGRIISFFMRLAQVIGRSFALLCWFLVCFALFILWIVFPFLLTYGLIRTMMA